MTKLTGGITLGDFHILPYVEAAAASPENQCHVHIGPMACGTSVVANRDVLEKQVRSQL